MNLKNVEDVYPLSPLQQGMLFHTLDAPQSGVYVVQLVFTLRGHLDAPAFRKAWQRVVERHAALRTAFFWEGLDEPLQVVRNEVELPWAVSDWQALPADERTVRLEAFLQADREQGFDLTQSPLMRCALLQVSEDTCWFVWTYHHLVLDGWSWPLVLDEALSFYRGRQPGPDTPRPHREYIAWLQQQDLAEAEAFWRRALRSFAAPTRLAAPQAGPGPARPGGASHELHLRLPVTSTTALVSMAREQRLTLNTLVPGRGLGAATEPLQWRIRRRIWGDRIRTTRRPAGGRVYGRVVYQHLARARGSGRGPIAHFGCRPYRPSRWSASSTRTAPWSRFKGGVTCRGGCPYSKQTLLVCRELPGSGRRLGGRGRTRSG